MKAIRNFLLFLTILILQNQVIHTTSWGAPEVKVLTYNVWEMSVPLEILQGYRLFEFQITPDREIRLPLICDELKKGQKEGKWDLVFIQEAWTDRFRNLLKNCGYEYSLDLDNFGTVRAMDSGLLILSRFPIIGSNRLIFPQNGSWTNFYDGEFLVNKSGIIAHLVHPDIGRISVATCHLVSRYPHDPYIAQREDQARNFHDWARKEADGNPLILGGDFNVNVLSTPECSDYENAAVFLQNVPGFSRWGNDTPTLSVENAWNREWNQSEVGLVDLVYGSSEHFFPKSGGIAMDQPLYPTSLGDERPLSDHFGYETTFVYKNGGNPEG